MWTLCVLSTVIALRIFFRVFFGNKITTTTDTTPLKGNKILNVASVICSIHNLVTIMLPVKQGLCCIIKMARPPKQQTWNGIWDHYGDAIMDAIASHITSLTIVYSAVYSGADQIKHQSSASLAFVRGIHRGPVNSPHKWPVTRKMFPFDDVIM